LIGTTDQNGKAKLSVYGWAFKPGLNTVSLGVDNDTGANAGLAINKVSPAIRIEPPFNWSVNTGKNATLTIAVANPATGEPVKDVSVQPHKQARPGGNYGGLTVKVLGPSDAEGLIQVQLSGNSNTFDGSWEVWFSLREDPTVQTEKGQVSVE
jgi:hypothetical protein